MLPFPWQALRSAREQPERGARHLSIG